MENMSDDLISRQAAIDAIWEHATRILESSDYDVLIQDVYKMAHRHIAELIKQLPSAQPEISRIEQELHGKTPEEQYEFLYWLLLKFGLTYTDSRLAVIEWLRGEQDG